MKTDDRGVTLLWALGAIAAVLLFAVTLVMVRNDASESVSEIELLREFSDSGFTAGEFDDFPTEEGVAEFDSVEDAEASAGYHIPRPSSDFTLVDGMTQLISYSRRGEELTPMSSSEYESADGGMFAVLVIPREIGFPDLREFGDGETIGSKEGTLFEEGFLYFTWDCDLRSAAEAYCSASADPDVDRATFERFVESLN